MLIVKLLRASGRLLEIAKTTDEVIVPEIRIAKYAGESNR